jgi:hypothetical protein
LTDLFSETSKMGVSTTVGGKSSVHSRYEGQTIKQQSKSMISNKTF